MTPFLLQLHPANSSLSCQLRCEGASRTEPRPPPPLSTPGRAEAAAPKLHKLNQPTLPAQSPPAAVTPRSTGLRGPTEAGRPWAPLSAPLLSVRVPYGPAGPRSVGPSVTTPEGLWSTRWPSHPQPHAQQLPSPGPTSHSLHRNYRFASTVSLSACLPLSQHIGSRSLSIHRQDARLGHTSDKETFCGINEQMTEHSPCLYFCKETKERMV